MKSVRAPIELELVTNELSPGGEGVAIVEHEGERRAVFVAGVASGERIRAEVDFRSRPARGRVLDVLEKSVDRVMPRCPHVDRCGGCDWMFLSVPAQAREHAEIARRLLGLDVPPVIHAAPRALGYRTRARVHIEARRGRISVGMFARRSHAPVKVEACAVLEPALDEARAHLGSWLEGATGRGEASLSLGRPGAPRRAVLELRWQGELPGSSFTRLEQAAKGDVLSGARIFWGDVKTPATVGDPTPYILGADGEPLRLAPGGFSQASEDGNAKLAVHVRDRARALSDPHRPCLELYAGAGNLTVLLARDRDVTAVEQNGAACDAARENLAARGLKSRVVHADADAYPVPKAAGLIVLDPPREGARALAEALADAARKARKAPPIVYVSCEPPTLARDVAALRKGGYSVVSADTFEMFPQTSHVETVVTLVHENGRQ
jgi:23S rRNA (uracil1939-C5)-methyltransferase